MSATSNYKLKYFDVKCLGEPIRWIFHYKEIPFEDERIAYNFPEWFAGKKQEFSNSVEQVPVLVVNGKEELCQSSAISTYLADEFGLLGETSWDRARGNEVICLVSDLFLCWRKNIFEKDEARKVADKVALDQQFRRYYSKFNQLLEAVEGDFLNGPKVTHADFWLASLVNTWNKPLVGPQPVFRTALKPLDDSIIYVDLLDEYPALKKHQKAVLAIPQIKKWITERPTNII